MTKKEDIQKMFSAYFDGLKTITDYFGVGDDFNPDEFDITDETTFEWKIKDDVLYMFNDKVGEVHGVYRREFHTLVLSEDFGSCYAMVLDNDLEIK